MSKIKICGLTRMEDILAVNDSKPDYVGFVFYSKSRRYVSPDRAEELKAALSSDIQSVGVFVNEDSSIIEELAGQNIIDLIQLHGQENEEMIQYLKQTTKKPVIKAVSVESPKDIERWENSSADYLLFDNGAGGTGEKFQWDYIKGYHKPFFLAGGLNLSNLAEAHAQGAYALDLSGGAETEGVKDPAKIQAIVRTVRKLSDGCRKNNKFE